MQQMQIDARAHPHARRPTDRPHHHRWPAAKQRSMDHHHNHDNGTITRWACSIIVTKPNRLSTHGYQFISLFV